MSEVVALRRSGTLLWAPCDGDELPVQRPRELEAHLSAWRDYGHVAAVHGPPSNHREVNITALGDDGWLVKVRDEAMVKGRWSYSKTLTRLLEAGSLPNHLGDSPWYVPNESTDLAGSVLIAEQIQFNPVPIAQAVWAWLTNAPMPHGYGAGKAGYDHAVFTSAVEALAWIADSSEQPWPTVAARSTAELAEELGVDRVVVTRPGQITLRVPGRSRRVCVQHRVRMDEAQVRVLGMTDELGREYSMNLPSREITRISRRRVRR